MKNLLILIWLLIAELASAQVTTNFGANTSLMIGDNAIFYTGANTTFGGALIKPDSTPGNMGEIVAFSNLDFVNNKDVGDITLVGTTDQTIKGDTLVIDNLIVRKEGDEVSSVILETNQIIVEESLNIESGVVVAEDQEDFVINGELISDENSRGYLSGTMVALTTTEPVTFPIGVSGFANYMTVTSNTPGVELRIECKPASPDELYPDEDTQGLADEVEWTIQTLSGTAEVTLSVDFAGVNLQDLPNGKSIRAKKYRTTLQLYSAADSLYHALKTENTDQTEADGAIPPTEGRIVTSDVITVTSEPQRLAIGISPVLVQPEFFMPTVFAPNGAFEENRILKPFYNGADVSFINFRVFDSFNKEVYNTSESGTALDLTDIGWDGKLAGGLDAPEGIYYYNLVINYTNTVEGNDLNKSESFSKLGTVMLVK